MNFCINMNTHISDIYTPTKLLIYDERCQCLNKFSNFTNQNLNHTV